MAVRCPEDIGSVAFRNKPKIMLNGFGQIPKGEKAERKHHGNDENMDELHRLYLA